MSPSTFPLYDALLHGQLEALLRQWRGEGRSFRDVAELLNERLPGEMAVVHTTVYRWCQDREITKPEEAA